MDSKISAEIWDDPEFVELNDPEKLAVFWILTKVNLLGYVETTPRKLARDIEAPFETIEGACKGLVRGFVKTEKGVWCRNYIRKQFGCGQSLVRSLMSKSIRKQVAAAPPEIRLLIEQEYPEIFNATKELGSSLVATREGEGVREGVGEGIGEGISKPLEVEDSSAPESPALIRARELFRMQADTPLDSSSSRAWSKNKKAAAALSDSDWSVLQWVYRQKEGAAATYRRKDLSTFLNNITSELLRAKEWAKQAGVNPAAAPVRPVEPAGWKDILESEDPSFNCTTWVALPESLKAYVRQRAAEIEQENMEAAIS